MPSLNKTYIIGNLTREPEIKFTPKGTAVGEISLAVNRVYSNDQGEKKEDTTFVDVELWGRQAEIAGEYLKKGRPVFIEGRLKVESWEDKESGAKRSKMKVVCENLQLLGGGKEDSGDREESSAPRKPQQGQSQGRQQQSGPRNPPPRGATPPPRRPAPSRPLQNDPDDSEVPF